MPIKEEMPELSLSIVSSWQKVKVIPKTPIQPELYGASPVAYRAEHMSADEHLSFKTVGTLMKVTLQNRLMYDISAPYAPNTSLGLRTGSLRRKAHGGNNFPYPTGETYISRTMQNP